MDSVTEAEEVLRWENALYQAMSKANIDKRAWCSS